MPTNLFDTNFDQSYNLDLQGLKDAQTGTHLPQYGLNEGHSFSPGADLSFYHLTNGGLADFSNQQLDQGVGSRYQSPEMFNPVLSPNNDDLTGLNKEHIVDAWNSSTTPQPTTPQPATPAPATTDNSFIQDVVNLTNDQRLNAGLQPLRLNLKLDNSAQAHSEDMALHDYFSHTGLDGSSAGDRAQAAGYQFSSLGENIAAGYATPQDVVQGWMNSPGHRANILNPNFQEIGVGFYDLANDTGNVNYHSYWTEDFGTALNV